MQKNKTSRNYPYNNIMPTYLIPSFKLLQPHIRAKHDLIPLREGEKIPRDKYWRTRDYSKMSWWEHMRNGGNVGVRLRSDQLITDVDPRNYTVTNGGRIDSLWRLSKDLGIDFTLMPRVKTGAGGWHFYANKPADLVIVGALKEYPGIEFKSAGQQVVAAGSVHPNTIELYEVEDDPIIDELWMATQAPQTLLTLIARKNATSSLSTIGEYTADQLAEMLSGLDPVEFRDHDAWRSIMMASHHATAGEGVDEFIAWSTGDPYYVDHGDIIRKRWESLHAEGAGRVTYSTLHKALHDCGNGGLIPPTTTPEEDFAGMEVEDGISF